ncbi:MAG: MBL fold metallo-hydrolase [Acetobacteraceae bacterium]|nr:MBL fold metallo-hydrolase [Acetobacteraceae bacterium]
MTQQEPLGSEARAQETDDGSGAHEIAPDLAYALLLMVNVVFYGRPGAGDREWVLIDAGLIGTGFRIKRLARQRFGEHSRPKAILLTHGHFDHVGVLEDLAEEWDVPVYAHEREHPYLNGRAAYPPGDPKVGGGLLARLSPLFPTRPVNVGSRLKALPGDHSVPGMPGWRWLHTPGHSPGHVSFWRESDRTMVAGDAFITTAQESAYAVALQATELHGPPRYFTIDWESAGSSVAALAALEPELVITGHGRAMSGPTMRAALHDLARDFSRVSVPAEGRYVAHPARAEDGSAYHAP